MRETRTAQQSIFQSETDHEIAHELKRMSDWLDDHPELLSDANRHLRIFFRHCVNVARYPQFDHRRTAQRGALAIKLQISRNVYTMAKKYSKAKISIRQLLR